MKLNKMQFSLLYNISPAIFNHTYDSYESIVETGANTDLERFGVSKKYT